MGGGNMQLSRSYPQFDRTPRGPEIRHIYDDRLSQFTDKGEYRDVNLQSMLYHGKVDGADHLSIEVYSVPGLERPLFADAIRNDFQEASNASPSDPRGAHIGSRSRFTRSQSRGQIKSVYS